MHLKGSASSNATEVNLFANMATGIETVGFDMAIKENIEKDVGVSLEQSQFIEAQTRGQSSSNIWFFERSKRVTASIFERVMNRREKIFPKSVIDSITKGRDGKKIYSASLQWGKEAVALEMYKNSYCKELQVVESGLIINPQWPWLGASTDGVLVTNGRAVGCIKIKSPFKKKDKTLLNACKDKKFYMEMSHTGLPSLKKLHAYSYQCQGVMNILGLEWLDSIVYTEKDLHVQRIPCDKKVWREKCFQS